MDLIELQLIEQLTALKQQYQSNANYLPFGKFTFWFEMLERNDLESAREIVGSADPKEKDLLLNGEFVSDDHYFCGRTVKPTPCHVKTPLAVAACGRSGELIEYLLSSGSDPAKITSVGNIIHILIHTDYLRQEDFTDVFDTIAKNVSHEQMKTMLFQEDKNGLRPLELAARLSAFGIFERIFNMKGVYRFPKWRDGQHIFTCFDVTDYETFPRSKRRQSPLLLISETDPDCAKKQQTRKLLFSNVMKQWIRYKYLGNMIFIVLWAIFRLALVTTYISTTDDNTPGNETDTDSMCENNYDFIVIKTSDSFLYHTLHISICCFLIIFDIFEFLVISAKRRKLFQQVKTRKSPAITTTFYRISQFLFVVGFLLVRIGSIIEMRLFVDLCSILTSLLSLWPILFFVQLVPYVGHFVIIIQRMLFHMAQFLVVFIVIFFVFSLTFYNMFSVYKSCDVRFATLSWSMYSTFQIMLNMINIQTVNISDHTAPAILHIIYILFVQILLLNFLIAIMTNTVTDVSEIKDVIEKLTQVDLSRLVERRVTWFAAPYYKWWSRRYLYHENGRIYIGCYVSTFQDRYDNE